MNHPAKDHLNEALVTVTDFAMTELAAASKKVNDEAIALAFSLGYNAALNDNNLASVGIISPNGK